MAHAAGDGDLLAPLVPPPDYSRFRKVPAWEGTFRVTQQMTTKLSKFTTSVREWSGSIVGTILLDDEGHDHFDTPDLTKWIGKIRGTVQIDSLDFGWPRRPDGVVDRSRMDYVRRQSGVGPAQCPGILNLQFAAGKYTIDGSILAIDAPWSKTANGKTTTGVNRTGVGEYSKDMMQGTLPASGLVLSGRTRKDFTSGDDGREVYTRMTSWELHPAGGELELVVEPLDYDHWLPEGNYTNYTDYGNEMKIVARLQRKDKSPLKDKAKKFIFQLVEVSNEQGICLNFPAPMPDTPGAPSGLGTDDLAFLQARNGGASAVSDAGRTLEIAGESLTKATATLSCFDWGAYGVLRVTAVMSLGGEIAGHLIGEEARTEILLPKRQDLSAIADAWKKDTNTAEMADRADMEMLPWGHGHAGDGLSLYEEYRGFYYSERVPGGLLGKQHRTDPHKKDLFIHNELPHSAAALDAFRSATRFLGACPSNPISTLDVVPDMFLNVCHEQDLPAVECGSSDAVAAVGAGVGSAGACGAFRAGLGARHA